METIRHCFDIKTDIEKVKEAILTERGGKGWWTTDVKKEDDVLHFQFMEGFNPQMKIIKEENGIIQWKCTGGAEAWAGDRFTFSLEETEDGTRVMFTQEYSNEVTEEQYGRFNFNWAYYLQSLVTYCETGQGKPFKPN